MNNASSYAIGVLLVCAASLAARASPESPKLVVTEGNNIGYASVADALDALESKGLTPTPGLHGETSFVEPDTTTAWKFAGKDDPAYPSVVRYVYTRSGGILHAEVTILCEASAGRCDKFRSDIRETLAQLERRMAGDPSAKCSVNGSTMSCGAEPGANPAN